jgi:hypothetical protein
MYADENNMTEMSPPSYMTEMDVCSIHPRIKILVEAERYNPNYSGGRDQEDHSLKPAQGK